MHGTFLLTTLFCLLLLVSPAIADVARPTSAPSTEPANGWDRSWFAYDRPDASTLVVEETTPTQAQMSFSSRPPRMTEDRLDDAAKHAKPRTLDGVDIVRLRFRDADGEVVPALLCTPVGKTGPFPVVIAGHGLGSNKAQVIGQVAPALIKRGFAIIAPDLPLHGERPGDPHEIRGLAQTNPFRAFELYRRGVRDVRQCIDIADSRPELDTRDGVTLVGYSMGSWINSVAGAADRRVRDMVLMVGGAHDVPPALLSIPQVAACQPSLAIAHFAGRSLLMLNAKSDYTVTPDMGRRLFSAAQEPKEIRWFPGGHLLPQDAYEQAAAWIAAMQPKHLAAQAR
jgi:dienelactone hydrolase